MLNKIKAFMLSRKAVVLLAVFIAYAFFSVISCIHEQCRLATGSIPVLKKHPKVLILKWRGRRVSNPRPHA